MKSTGWFPAPSPNTIVGTSVFQFSLSPLAWPFSSCPFKSLYLLYLCFLMSCLIFRSETYWQGACFDLCPQRMLTSWKKAPENTTSLARNITTASACTASASTPSTRRSRPAGNTHFYPGKVGASSGTPNAGPGQGMGPRVARTGWSAARSDHAFPPTQAPPGTCEMYAPCTPKCWVTRHDIHTQGVASSLKTQAPLFYSPSSPWT